MGQSNAPGETRKTPKEWARLTIQVDVQFTPKGIAQIAPDWDKTGIAALRQLFKNAKENGVDQEYTIKVLNEFMSAVGFEDQMLIDNVSVMVGK